MKKGCTFAIPIERKESKKQLGLLPKEATQEA